MTTENSAADERQQRWGEALVACLKALEGSPNVDRQALVAAHPEFAEELAEFFAQRDHIQRLAAPLWAAPPSALTERGLPEDTLEEADSSGEVPVRSFGDYEVLERIARGGMGVVYKARQVSLNRLVALKMIRRGDLGSEEERRFRHEAEIVALLDHPNIVPIYEVGEASGRHFFSMKLMEGGSLAGQPARFVEGPRSAARTMVAVARAVHHAHQHGILHRDLKPANILLDRDGTPHVTDFGLAKRMDADESLSPAGALVGTLRYMAPEQLAAGRAALTTSADVYGLGTILYALLTGQPPFAGADTLKTLRQVQEQAPEPPNRVNPRVDRDLATVCLKCLEKDPHRRYPSAGAVADDLERWLAGEPIAARPVRAAERLGRWCWRNPLGAGLTALVVLGLMGGGLLLWRAHEAETRAELAHRLHERDSELRAQIEARALLEQARQRVRTPSQGRRLETQRILGAMAKVRPRINDPAILDRLDLETRSIFALTLGVPDLRVAATAKLPSLFLRAWRLALHPDGASLAIATATRPVRWVCGQPPPAIPAASQPGAWAAYSPDGKYLVFAPAGGGLELWDETVTRAVATLSLPGGEAAPVFLAVGFDQGAKALWACRADGHVSSWSLVDFQAGAGWDVPRGPDRNHEVATAPHFTAAAFNHDASMLAVGDRTGRVKLCNRREKPFRELPADRPWVEALAWSPDSQLVAVGTHDGNVQLWQTNGTPRHLLPAFAEGVSSIQFHPDGAWIIAGGRDHSMMMWDVFSGEPLLSGDLVVCGFAGKGRRLAAAGSRGAAFLDLLVSDTVRSLSGHRAAVQRLAWSNGHRRLASVDTSYEVRVWDASRPVALDAFGPVPGPYYAGNTAVAFSADARQVAFASGSTILVRDVETRCTLGREHGLPPGFEKLAPSGPGTFRLVREEERQRAKGEWQTVVYELRPGQPPGKPRALRRCRPGERHFAQHQLTPDGRYYCWVGPREPRADRRAEVYEVATGTLIRSIPMPTFVGSRASSARLSADGQTLYTANDQQFLVYDLRSGAGPVPLPAFPDGGSADQRWLAYTWSADNLRGKCALSIHPGRDQRAWLELLNRDLRDPHMAAFSHDGRYVAWANQSGLITVADLPALQQEVRAFEERLRHE
jgi:WD40 repeat protein